MREILIYAVALPLLTTSGWLLLIWRPWHRFSARRDEVIETQRRWSWTSGAGFATAYCVCHLGLHGLPVGDVLEAWEWLLFLAPLAVAVALLDSVFKSASWISVLGWAVLSVMTSWFLIPSFVESPWMWRPLLAATVFGLGISQRFQSDRFAGIVLPLCWILIGSVGLPVLIASANAKFGFFSTSLAASSGAAVVFWLLCRGSEIARGALPVASVMFPSILLSGYFNDYGGVPLAAFMLLALAPLGLWAGTMVPRFRSATWTASVTGMLAVALMCGVAIYLAWPALTAEPAY